MMADYDGAWNCLGCGQSVTTHHDKDECIRRLRAENEHLRAIEAAARELLSPPPPDSPPGSAVFWVQRERALRAELERRRNDPTVPTLPHDEELWSVLDL